MCLAGPHTLVVACARHVLQYDARKLTPGRGEAGSALMQARPSSIKFQTRVVRAFIDGSGFATGSVEGRVAIDFLDQSPAVQASSSHVS